MKRIALISTGGTIEKTYDALTGVLANRVAVLDVMLAQMDLRGVSVSRLALMNKDSLDMTPEDHALIAATVHNALRDHDGVIVVHGTDRLAVSGEAVLERLAREGAMTKPVVFTGAMKPYELRDTDAQQNLTEAGAVIGDFRTVRPCRRLPRLRAQPARRHPRSGDRHCRPARSAPPRDGSRRAEAW